MKGIQNLIVMILLFGCHFFTFIWTFTMLWAFKYTENRTISERFRSFGLHLIPTSIAIVVMFFVLRMGSRYDFIDRCRPNGSGFCNNGLLPDVVRAHILTDLLVAGSQIIILPVLLPILIGLLIIWISSKFAKPAHFTT